MINQEEYFENVASYKLLAKHEVGQNFLIDQDVAKKIISFLEIKEGDHVLEIGSGAGSLSFFLAQYDEPIDLIDIDEALVTKLKNDLEEKDVNGKQPEELIDFICKRVIEEYEDKIKDIPEEVSQEFEKVITLQVVDNYWMEHINTMSHLREGIHLRGYAQEDPLRAYTMEGFDLFDSMLQKIDKDISIFLLKAEIRQNLERKWC